MVIAVNYTYHGEHIAMYITAKSLCHTSATNIILYVNYISIKKGLKKGRQRNWYAGL